MRKHIYYPWLQLSHARSMNNRHTETSCIRCALIIKLHVALQYMVSNVGERERKRDSLRRERETDEKRYARFVNANLITFCNGI